MCVNSLYKSGKFELSTLQFSIKSALLYSSHKKIIKCKTQLICYRLFNKVLWLCKFIHVSFLDLHLQLHFVKNLTLKREKHGIYFNLASRTTFETYKTFQKKFKLNDFVGLYNISIKGHTYSPDSIRTWPCA